MRVSKLANALMVWLCLTSMFPLARAEAAQSQLLERIAALEKLVGNLQDRILELEGRLAVADRSGSGSTESVMPEAQPAQAVSVPTVNPSALNFFWREGIRGESPSGEFRFQIGGRIMNDWAFMSEDRGLRSRFGSLLDGTEFRRSRLFVSGLIHDRVEFKAQYDFAGGDADFKDVYIGLVDLPIVGGVRTGHFKEPFGLEELTSSKYISFMERSLADAFAPSRNTGIMLHNHILDDRLTWAAGVFRDTDDFGNRRSDGDYNVTARITALPWYAQEGEKLLHAGFDFSRRSPQFESLRFSSRPEAHLAPRFVDTGSFGADSVNLWGVEGALVYGPASVQSEFMRSSVDRTIGPDLDFSGFYVQGSYFLTGEHRRYDRREGVFGRTRPRRNLFGGERSPGAWEIAARYSFLDLNDQGIRGGRLDNFTLGLNWYLNPNTRLMWNYVLSDLDEVGQANIFQLRFQVDF